MSRTWAYLSNYLVYSSMAVYTLSFIAHAIETAWAVRVTTEDSKKNMDYKRTEKVARIATAMMILGFVLLFAGVVARGVSAGRVPWGNMYEFSITGALAFSGAYLVALRKYDLRWLVFPLWTFAVIAGAIWAESAWGRYWGWDPKETWAFITWVAYAAYLHARVTVGWRGRKAAWLCLFAGSTFLFNYVYINVWGTGKHTYSGL